MGIEIEVIPISSDSEQFQCSVLRIGKHFKILLDCGWTEAMDVTQYASLPPEFFADIDLVLLSHYSLAHCGALPYLLFRSQGKKRSVLNEISTRVVATEAVRRMGELTLASLYEDVDKVKEVNVSDDSYSMTLEDIVTAFNGIQPVQFNEKFELVSRSFGGKNKISITAQPAGRLMGGAYFVITVGSEQIVYAVDYALVGGRAVSGMYPSPARNASILITDSSKVASEKVKKAEESLIATIKHTLRNGGTVLMPVDPNGPTLDLLLMLESAFMADSSLLVYPVVFLSPLGDVVLDQVKTRMEWMNKNVLTDFEESVNFLAHPFLLNHVELCSDLSDFNEKFNQQRRSPKVVIATSSSLDFGDSREIFAKISHDTNSLLLFTQVVGLSPSSLAFRILNQPACSEFKETQFVKSSFPDEQLRQIYRECLEKEAQDGELRRRRIREKNLGAQQAAAPSSASAVPVDLIRGHHELEGPDSGGGSFFRPLLFAAQTLSSGSVVKANRAATDYGEELNSIEVDTWRAHAEMGDLGAAREAAALAHQQLQQSVKSERNAGGVKGEHSFIKGDIDGAGGDMLKGELGVAAGLMSLGAAESFDWRRDLQVRFGEPQRVEVRERVFRVACQVKQIAGLDSHAAPVHRREFIAAAKPRRLVMLPTRNTQDLQLVSLMMKQQLSEFYATMEEDVATGASISISGEKKWIHLDPSLLAKNILEFKEIPNSQVKVAKLSRSLFLSTDQHNEDLIKVPCGDFIDYAIIENPDKKRIKSDPSLLINSKPFRLGEFARLLAKYLPREDSKINFVTTEFGRALSVKAFGGGHVVVIASKQWSACPLIELLGPPSACFYKVRSILYSSNLCL